MMRKQVIFLLLILFIYCTGAKKSISKYNENNRTFYDTIQRSGFIYDTSESVKGDTSFRVVKIDSIANFYLVFAIRHDEKFKIITEKENVDMPDCKKKIMVGQSYYLTLRRYIDAIVVNGKLIESTDYAEWHCYPFAPNVFICNEPKNGFFSLYFTDDIKGMCYCR